MQNGFNKDAAGFDMASMNESFREFAEKSMAQGQTMYESFRAAADEATGNAQKSFEAYREGTTALSMRAMENIKANTEFGMQYVERFAKVKSFAEVVELQGEFFRTAFERLSQQAREVQELAMGSMEKTTAPMKATAEKAGVMMRENADKASANIKSAMDKARPAGN